MSISPLAGKPAPADREQLARIQEEAQAPRGYDQVMVRSTRAGATFETAQRSGGRPQDGSSGHPSDDQRSV